jgi:hypothetical protein
MQFLLALAAFGAALCCRKEDMHSTAELVPALVRS